VLGSGSCSADFSLESVSPVDYVVAVATRNYQAIAVSAPIWF